MYNKRIKSAKKYSNVTIFDRREKDAALRQRLRHGLISNKNFNHNYLSSGHHKSTAKIKQFKNYFPTLSTNQETNTLQNFFSIRDKCITINNCSLISKKTTRPCTANYKKYFFDNKSPFVTETFVISPSRKNLYSIKKNYNRNNINSTIQEKNKRINTNFNCYNKNVDIINDDIDISEKEYINFSKTENADILKTFKVKNNQFFSPKHKKGKSNPIRDLKKYQNICYNKTIEKKTKQLNRKKEVGQELVFKGKEMQLIQYISKLKLEKTIRIKENFQSQLDYFDQLKNSLYSYKKLFNAEFFDKMTDYIKFLNYKKDLENVYSTQLEEEKFAISREIFRINNKKEKLQHEKDNIMRWIFFQIRIKERKLKLPFYYKIILENNFQKIISEKKEKNNDKNNKKDEDIFKSNRYSSPLKNNKNIHKIRNSVKSSNLSVTPSKTKKFDNIKNKFSINNFNNNFNNKEIFYYAEFNIEDPKFEEELIKINKYKENLIFHDCEELEEQFKFLENKIITLINYYNHLKKQLFNFKKELVLIKTEKQKIENENVSRIKTKEHEKNEIYKDTENKQYTIDTIKSKSSIIKRRLRKRIKSANIFKINRPLTKNSLSNKVNILFENCKRVNTCNDNDIFNEIKISKKKNKVGKGGEIILKLKFVERVTDFLCGEYEKITKGNSIKKKKVLKKIIYEIEKKHKIKNYEIQKQKKLERELELLNKIEEKNKKIYFLPYKKVDYAAEEMFKEKQEIKKNLETISNDPDVMNFLSD